MVKDIGHFVGGKHVKGTSGRYAEVYNPNTGEVSARVALASPEELRAAVGNASVFDDRSRVGGRLDGPQSLGNAACQEGEEGEQPAHHAWGTRVRWVGCATS